MSNQFVAADPGIGDELHVARWKQGDPTDATSSSGVILSSWTPNDDFWKWSPEAEAHARKVLELNPDLFGTDLPYSTFAHSLALAEGREYQWWYRRDGHVKVHAFKVQRSAKARKRKAVRNFVKPVGAVAFYDIEAGAPGEIHFTTTGRMNPTEPATYELTKDGYVRHEPK